MLAYVWMCSDTLHVYSFSFFAMLLRSFFSYPIKKIKNIIWSAKRERLPNITEGRATGKESELKVRKMENENSTWSFATGDVRCCGGLRREIAIASMIHLHNYFYRWKTSRRHSRCFVGLFEIRYKNLINSRTSYSWTFIGSCFEKEESVSRA